MSKIFGVGVSRSAGRNYGFRIAQIKRFLQLNKLQLLDLTKILGPWFREKKHKFNKAVKIGGTITKRGTLTGPDFS